MKAVLISMGSSQWFCEAGQTVRISLDGRKQRRLQDSHCLLSPVSMDRLTLQSSPLLRSVLASRSNLDPCLSLGS